MDQIQAIFTKRPYHPGSLLIRVANPVSFIKIAPASHVIIVDGKSGYGMEASMTHGVRRALLSEMLKGLTTVARIKYDVPDAEAGLVWARETAQRKAKYDYRGALALGLAPDRDWQEDTDWFCFEFGCNVLAKSGRKIFSNSARITANMLMSVNPGLSPNK